jgi:glyoxalase family protein
MNPISGLHHITAVARDAQRNLDFYRNILGQRLVKKTVNFDDPGTYHFYFADAAGTPGTVLTFFPWQGVKRGVRGNGAANALAYQVPTGSLGFWQEHLSSHGVATKAVEQRFGEQVLPFDDPDGLRIELVEGAPWKGAAHWEDGPIDRRYALQGFHSTTLWLSRLEPTANLLTGLMGYTLTGQEATLYGERYRFTGAAGALSSIVDILLRPGESRSIFGAGSIHHIAFRVPDDPAQFDYLSALRTSSLNVTDVQDRNYFHSIYFREPGGVLFEIATNTPGFDIDEPAETLGEALKLPEWLEPQRKEIEAVLQPLTYNSIEKAAYEPTNG